MVKASFLAVSIIFLWGFSAAIAEDDIGIEGISPLSPSQLSDEEQQMAISFFESQHDSWLATRTLSATYEMSVRNITEGNFVEYPNGVQTGSISFSITPIQQLVKLQSPAGIQVKIVNNANQLNLLLDNAFDEDAASHLWTDGEVYLDAGEMLRLVEQTFQIELFFFPMDFMVKTYNDGSWNNKYTEEKEVFFAVRGVPWRRSTQEETDEKFGGESQYLFMISPALTDAHYWFSAENGELRQVDVFLAGDLVKSFRYENYIEKQGDDAKYPQRLILTSKSGTGDQSAGTEYTIKLHNVELNIDIPADQFIPH